MTLEQTLFAAMCIIVCIGLASLCLQEDED